ncbi:histone acetyltransferase 1 [Teratosphaeriaceae sp. CCFEE 6253]|nr:histone acetyltransferase 1 [Teratosphaeriaceae sp. CCFEE 6253]
MEVDDEQLAAHVSEWSTSTNDCLKIELVNGKETSGPFSPAFTYPIFGEEEVIFGYEDPVINLSFAAHDLTPHLEITHGDLYPAQGDVKPTDIRGALADFLPESAFREVSRDNALKDPDAASFVPPGEKMGGYKQDEKRYEVWCSSLADERARRLLENMQILVPMFIEGGTMLSLGQDWSTQRWKLFLLYGVESKPRPSTSRYSLVGYGTSYRVFALPKHLGADEADILAFSGAPLSDFLLHANDAKVPSTSPLDLPSRERLSQFFILPPFQGSGHGQHLYNTMYTYLAAPPNVREFTVEDPNEDFDDLRDLCDLLHLRQHVPEFTALRINTTIKAEDMLPSVHIPTHLIVDGAARERIKVQTKMVDRQLDRLVEMHTLSFIPASHRSRNRITRKDRSSNGHDKAYYFWRLYAKQRLYIHNRDQLIQLEKEERVEKLEAALDSVQEGYVKMLEKVVKHAGRNSNGQGAVAGSGETVGGAAKPIVRKRKVVQDDEDDDEVEREGVAAEPATMNGRKKTKVGRDDRS